MTNVLFNRETLRVTGMGREPLPFEVEIKNVDEKGLHKLSKTIEYTEEVQKTDEDGNTLFYLPQDPIEVEVEKIVRVKKTEPSGEPVLIQVKKPLLDENNRQVTYEIKTEKITPAVYDEEGNLIEEEKWEWVGAGVFQKCYILVEEQEKDKNGDILYWHVETIREKILQEQPPIEITQSDPRWNEDLEKVMTTITKTKTITFDEAMQEFTYTDIVKFKEQHITKGTLFTDYVLFELFMSEDLFVTDIPSFKCDLGFDFFSLPPGGQVRVKKFELPKPTDFLGVKAETNTPGLTIKAAPTIAGLKTLDKNNEVVFSEPITETYIVFENNTDTRIDIYSFAVLV